MGFKTIRHGEAAAIWSPDGTCEIVEGPRRLFLFRKKCRLLPLATATQNQYLRVQHRDGRVVHVRGPASMFESPLDHHSLTVNPAISLTSHEALVAYRPAPVPDAADGSGAKSGYTAEVERFVIRGPCMHVPEPNEWLHEFSWHGTDESNKTHLLPNKRVFTKLPIIPDQFYYNVRDVRTGDDVLLTIKLMVFFEIVDIERMLDSTNDPIADFVNSVCADVISCAAARTYESFLENTAQLNELGTYPQLVQRAERSGFAISKVVYRGFHAPQALQEMHDGAIQSRTQLRLEAETQDRAQAMEDLKLEREAARSGKRLQLLEDEARHKQRVLEIEHQQELERKRAIFEADLEFERRRHEQLATYLQSLSGAGFEVGKDSEVLKHALPFYRTPEKTIQIQTSAAEAPSSALHFHN